MHLHRQIDSFIHTHTILYNISMNLFVFWHATCVLLIIVIFLSFQHIDVIFYYLRKKGKYGPDVPFRFTCTDCCIKTRVEEVFKLYEARNRDGSVVSKDDVVSEYIMGFRLRANTPWIHVDYVMMPIHIREKNHWVLVIVSFMDRCIWVYDSLHGRNGGCNVVVRGVVQKFTVILPLYLSATDFYGGRIDIGWQSNPAYKDKAVTDPFDVVIVPNLPQQASGSLYVYLFFL